MNERDRERDDSITHNPLPLPGDTLHTECWREGGGGDDGGWIGREKGLVFEGVCLLKAWRKGNMKLDYSFSIPIC